jgi:NAD+ diphosphatase
MSDPFIDELSAVVGFSGNPLDRLSEKRDDGQALAELAAHAQARSLVFVLDTPVLKQRGDALDAFFTLAEAEALGAREEQALLGQTHEGPIFATLLKSEVARRVESNGALVLPGREDLTLIDLRSLAAKAMLPRPTIAMMAQGKSLLFWHAKHRFCSQCGAPSTVSSAGWKRECAACKAQHFPRTDPVVIMLTVHGDRCLLGRQARFAPGMYSALAGFLEPGETIEEAVRREVMEESGISVGRVTYMASQPWPFPATLMIGCLAEALTDEVIVDYSELEDARWFTRAEVQEMLGGEHANGLGAPQPIAIARSLMLAWAFTGG